MSKSRDIADSAATINYIDGVTSNVQTQLNTLTTAVDNISVTNGSLTKTFTAGESSEITLSSSVLVPNVSVTKEIPQTGATNNNWDAAAGSYTLEDSAPATTLSWSGFGVSGATFVDSFSTSAQETSPTAVAFSTDGTKMFVAGGAGQDVNEYTLSTGFDVSTSTFVDSFSVSLQVAAPYGLTFNNDGTKMYVVDLVSGKDVNQYTLSTGFDVSTSTYLQSFSVSGQIANPVGIAFNTDGTRMFVVGSTAVKQYNLSTGFDVSSASYSQSFSVSAQQSDPTGIAFNSDGTKMFVNGTASDSVDSYSLSTGFNISTASFSESFNYSAQEASSYGLAFSPDGTKMFVVGTNGQDINEYTIPLSLTLGTGSFASTDVGKTINVNDGALVLTAADGSYSETTAPTSTNTAASGEWSMFGAVYDATADVLEVSNAVGDGYDLTVATFIQSFSVAAQETFPYGLAFNTTGTKMFILGAGGLDVTEYTLSIGFDVSTSTFVDSFSVSAQDTQPNDMHFSPDGTNMYFIGATNDNVYQYLLSTGFDVSTASYVRAFSVNTQESSPSGLTMSADGTKMFVCGSGGKDVNEYTLSTAFDISTAVFVDAFSVVSETGFPDGMDFNNDGTELFIINAEFDVVNKYALTTAYDISTASFESNFSVASEELTPRGITFSSTGSKMFVCGTTGDDVNEYSCQTSFITTGYQPCISGNIDSTYWTDINSLTATNAIGSGNVFYAVSNDAKTEWSVLDNTDGVRDIVRNNAGTWQYNNAVDTEGGALSSAVYNTTGTISQSAFGAFWANNGNLLIVASNSTDSIYKYTVTSAYDISTASESQSLSVSAKESVPTGVFFRADGLKFYVSGQGSNKVHEYTMTTAYDLSTASFTGSSPTTTNLTSVWFKEDGLKMYTINYGNSQIKYWTLSTAWDITSASYVSATTLPTKSAGCQDISFNSAGTELYVDDNTDDKIYKYTLSTAWDVTSVSYTEDFSHAGQLAQVHGMIFNSDLTEMILLNSTNWYKYTTSIESYTTNENWINATVNNEVQALRDSMSITINQMDSAALNAITDANQITLGDDLDFAAILYYNTGSTVPTYSGTAINYDANILNQGAVLGTDYNFDAPAGDKVRIAAVGAGNYKVRVV